MADFGATTWRTLGRRGVAICIPAVTQDNEQYFRQIRNRLRICPGRTLLQTLTPYKFLHVIARSEATGQSVLPAVGHDREQCLRRIRKSATNLPQRQQACPLSLRGCGLPQVCALVRNDMLKEGRVRGCKYVPPLSLRGAKRRGNPLLLRCNMTESSTLGECVSGYEFAQTAANLLSFSAGKTDCRTSVRTGSQ